MAFLRSKQHSFYFIPSYVLCCQIYEVTHVYSANGTRDPKTRQALHIFYFSPPLFSLGALRFATVLIWVMLIGISTAKTTGVKQMQRINYGVAFQKQSEIVLGQEYWHHTFEIPLPKKRVDSSFPVCDIVHQNCYILNQVISQLSAIKEQVGSSINRTVDFIHHLVPKMDPSLMSEYHSRSKRGLFDFVGSISKSLFGTATVEDVRKLARHVNILINKSNKFAKAMAHHDTLLSSFMVKTDERFENLMQGIQQNYEHIENITMETSKFIAHFENVSLKLSNLLIKQMNSSSVINKYLEELKLGLHEMIKGKLSPFIIHPKVLKHTIHHIQLILSEKFKGFYLIHTDPSHYYSSAQLLFARNHSTLYLSVKFPISTFSSPLSLYKVFSYPVPVNDTSNHGTQILDLPEYFVLTPDNQRYASLSSKKLSFCSGTEILYCSFSLTLVSSVKASCVSSLFLNAKSEIHQLCDFRFLLDVLKPSVEEIFHNTLLVYKTKTLAFDCQSYHKIVKGCNFCLIQTPCMCSVSTDSFFIPKKVEQCQNHTDDITILHPVNLALIQQFFSAESYNTIVGDTTFTTPVDITLPHFYIFNHTFSNVIAQDKKLHLSLKRIAQATLQDKKIFTSLSEPLLDGEISIDDSWPDTNGIIPIASLALSILLTVACIILFNKVRALTAALILLQKIPSSKAFFTPQTPPTFHFIQKSQTPTEEPFSVTFTSQLSQWPSMVLAVMTVLSFITAIHYIYNIFVTKHKTKVLIELSNGLTCITVPLVTLPLCPSDRHISAPSNILNMRISGTFVTRFHAEFIGLDIINKHTQQRITLPDTININPLKGRTLRHMFKSEFTSYILVTHHNQFKIIY